MEMIIPTAISSPQIENTYPEWPWIVIWNKTWCLSFSKPPIMPIMRPQNELSMLRRMIERYLILRKKCSFSSIWDLDICFLSLSGFLFSASPADATVSRRYFGFFFLPACLHSLMMGVCIYSHCHHTFSNESLSNDILAFIPSFVFSFSMLSAMLAPKLFLATSIAWFFISSFIVLTGSGIKIE